MKNHILNRQDILLTPRAALYILLTGVTLFRFFFTSLINITPDEAYYWNWSRHLDLSYYDHPPMVAYIIYITTLGNIINNEFFVRLGGVIMSLGISIVSFLFARDVFEDERAGLWSAVWVNSALLFSLGALIITPDTPQAFFISLYLYCLYQGIFYHKRGILCLSGLFLGLALLSKYTAILLLPSVLLFFILSPSHRYILRERGIYISILISLITFSPVLYWNYIHNWISFSFQLSHGLGGSFSNFFRSMPEFIGTQILLLTPFIFIMIIYSLHICFVQGKRYGNRKMLYLFCTSFPILLFFLLASLKSKIEGNWPSFGYLTAMVAMGGISIRFKTFLHSSSAKKRFEVLKKLSLASSLLILLASHLLILFPPINILKKTSLTKRLVGWKDMGLRVSQVLKDMDEDNVFIFGNRHQIISEISFYTDKHYETYQKGGYGRYPYLTDLSFLNGKNAVYVAEEGRSEFDYIKNYFNSVEELKPIDIIIRGERVRRFYIYICYNYLGGLINV